MINQDEFQFMRAPDLFSPNDCINLAINDGVQTSLSCVSLFRNINQKPSEVRHRALRRAVDFFTTKKQQQLWLLACACGEDNKIFRHRGIWGTLKEMGIQPGLETTDELAKSNATQTCLYAGTSYSAEQLGSHSAPITPASRSFFVLLPQDRKPHVEQFVRAGWHRGLSDLTELRDIAAYVSEIDGVLLRLFGQFDDPIAGVDCIMNRATYDGVFDFR